MAEEKLKYSKEQEKIIYSDEKTLLVSASAGSGKTKVLVERIVDLVINKNVNLKNMLVVTFTKLASLEMKSRLKQELEKKEKNDNVLKQLEQLNTANISTLHKFCEVIIKEFFYEVQIDPNFSLLEGTEENYYKNLALDNVLKEYAESDDEDFDNLFEVFYESRSDQKLKDNIFKIHSFLLSKPSDYFKNTLSEIYNTDIKNNPSIQYITNETKQCLDYYKEKLDSILIVAQSTGSNKVIEYVTTIQNLVNMLDAKDYFGFKKNYEILKEQFKKIRILKQKVIEENEVCDNLKVVKSNLSDDLKKFEKCYPFSFDSMASDFEFSKKMVGKFYEVVGKFEQEYSKQKLQMNKLDFNDLEKYLLKIFKNDSIRLLLQERFKYIFVDEYQDVNAIQEEIIRLLTKDNFVFMVGDVKQSIYMFRECNPQIFINKSETLSNENQNQVVLLNKNYRSDKNILEFNNFVFNKAMTKNTSKLDYENTSKLVFGETFKEQNIDEPKVNICLIKSQEKEKQEKEPNEIYSVLKDNFKTEDEKEIERQAYLIAEKIKELLDKEIYEKNTDGTRKINYRDIAILTRTGRHTKSIANVLSALKIPINSEYKVNLLKSSEAVMLVNILKTINNYQDDVALAGVLKSVAYDFSDYDLIEIKQKFSNRYFYQNVLEYINEQDKLSNKLKAVFDDIAYFKRFIMQNSISECLIEIVNKLDLKEKLYIFDNYAERLENINYFINTVEQIDNHNLTALIDYLENFDSSEQTLTIKNGDNSVYIGTIHSSKGLEYPVVFLANANRTYSIMSTTEKLIKNNEFGFAMDIYDTKKKIHTDSITKNIFKSKILEQEWQEELRLLYVALTRAQCYLYVVGSYDKPNFETIKNDYDVKSIKSYLNLLVGAFPEDVTNQINNGKDKILFDYNGSKFLIENYTDYKFDDSEQNEQSYLKDNQTFESDFNAYANKKFEHNNLSFKNTVTALYEMEAENNYNIEDFKLSTRPKGEDDFLLIGTQYHKIMEMLDFKQPFENQFETIVENEKLDKTIIDKEKIEKAYNAISGLIEKGDIVFREKQFMFYPKLSEIINSNVDEKILIQGMVDLFIIKPNEIVLVDYKTSRIKDEQTMIKKYKLQLDLYASAIEKFYKKTVSKKIIYSFYLDRVIIV